MQYLPSDFSFLDGLALFWLLFIWWGYHNILNFFGQNLKTLNNQLHDIRTAWMLNLMSRPNQIVDASLIGHVLRSTSFFANTTILVLAAVIGIYGAADKAYETITQIPFAVATSQRLFSIKLMLVIVMFAYAFFRFTWSIRQYTYAISFMGAAPLNCDNEEYRQLTAINISDMLTQAMQSFNAGLRCYYYALATVTWFTGPIEFILCVTCVFCVLVRRQFKSQTRQIITNQRRLMLKHDPEIEKLATFKDDKP